MSVRPASGPGEKIIGEKWVAGADWGQDTNEYNGHCLDTYFQYRSSYPESATFTRNDSNLAKYNGSFGRVRSWSLSAKRCLDLRDVALEDGHEARHVLAVWKLRLCH